MTGAGDNRGMDTGDADQVHGPEIGSGGGPRPEATGELGALVARARALLESASGADEATRLKALEDLHEMLEEELDRNVEQGQA